MNETDLLAFEEEIAQEFAAGRIRSPIHLGGGNELQLLDIFKGIKPDDWKLGGWRSHYLCLLAGVPRDELKAAILAGHSVSLCFPKQKVLCSGIVGGIAPIAVGLAWSLKQKNSSAKVHCFLGDMTARSGIVTEAVNYARGHGLSVRWIVEDNGQSVCTDTQASWGVRGWIDHPPSIMCYNYKLSRPHSGIGTWVRF